MTHPPRPWTVLGAVATGQLMVGVDATILALAVPGIDADLNLAAGTLAWVMAGYVLAAGSLMIAGGRIAQAVGYRRVMTVGLVTFGLASAIGGAATEGWVLVAARVAQGVGAAAMTPAAMARLSAAFPHEARSRAYGIFGMIMGSGTAIGLVLGGLLTQTLGWRACMYVNVAFVAIALILSSLGQDRIEQSADHGRGWWRGIVLAAGVASIIQSLISVDDFVQSLAFGVTGITVVAVFAVSDQRSHAPLVPFGVFRNPTRRVAYVGLFMWGIATINTFVTASGSLQDVHQIPPLAVGLLFLVYPASIQLGLFVGRRIAPRPETWSIGVGLALLGAGQIVFALAPEALATVLGALVLMGLGTSQIMPNANSAMNRDAGKHAGVAGAVGTTLQQLGGSVGLAVPVALAAVTTQSVSVTATLTALALVLASIVALRQSASLVGLP